MHACGSREIGHIQANTIFKLQQKTVLLATTTQFGMSTVLNISQCSYIYPMQTMTVRGQETLSESIMGDGLQQK